MINKNIIEGLKPHCETSYSPSYFIAITDIEQSENCGQESIKFSLCQINKPLWECKVKDDNGNVVEIIPGLLDSDSVYYTKDLTVTGIVEMNDKGYYYTKLIGYEGNVSAITDNRETEVIQQSHYIEVIETRLSDKISIIFEEEQETLPSILIDMDKKYKGVLYKDYDLEFKEKNELDTVKYTGVTITFNSLKTKKEYPMIKINIIGDPIIQNNSSEETNNENSSDEGD